MDFAGVNGGGSVDASSAEKDFVQCEKIVREWARSALEEEIEGDGHTLQDLLFFLHVPRTGGRTYFHCLVKKVYGAALECPRSYDKLRFDPRKPKCRLVATHDDYSIMSMLPREKTSVMTVLRHPVDRVFSAYEFSVEVASRFLVHPNLTSATELTKRIRAKHKGRDARKMKGLSYVNSNDSYNVEEMAMPLHQFINEPVVLDTVHNGATFQVAGLTNNSYLAEAHDVRHCVQKFTILGEHVLQVAQKRLDNMLFVGLTEKHRESAKMFVNVVGPQVISQIASDSSMEGLSKIKSVTEQNSLLSDSELDSNYHQDGTSDQKTTENVSTENLEGIKKNMTVEKIMEEYKACISPLRNSQSVRRTNSLREISPANFSKEARLLVPDTVLQQIRSLNSLDLRLFKYAEGGAQERVQRFPRHQTLASHCISHMFCLFYTPVCKC
ncbi:protein-tyrosine sulfotransferase [Citrus sinensis]|uniref:Protein-tyrosine sulfotransferase n=1 Tax=Citrus sinensis TaxID=2711 RepID=A0ACB8IUG0_CITSI|nr:protein-tyrosine sulfotransferase [Citrus sinensis]